MSWFGRTTAPSIARRLVLSLTAMMALLWFMAVGLGLVVMEEEYAEMFDGTLQDTAERLVPLVVDDLAQRGTLPGGSDEGAIGAPQQLQTGSSSGNPEYLIYQVRDDQGRILMRSHDAPEQPFDTPLAAGFWRDVTYQFYTATHGSGQVFVQVADAFGNREEALREGAVALFLPLLLLIPVSGIAILFVVQRTVKPVGDLRRQIERKDGGNMDPITAGTLPRELQPIAISVNLLMMRLKTALEAEREFASNSAHELRTPIAGALAQTQMLISELGDSANRHRAEQIEASLSQLGHLAEKLLQLSRAEAGIGISDRIIDLNQVLDMVLLDFWRSMSDPERLVLHRPEGARLIGPFSEDAFAIVLRNLIENALLHGKKGEPVEVSLDGEGRVRIVNGGALIGEGELNSLRNRFTRGKTEARGSGLGLSIVDRLLKQMGGQLELRSPANGRLEGFEAQVIFPQEPGRRS